MFRFRRRARASIESPARAAPKPVVRVANNPRVEPIWVDLASPNGAAVLGEAAAAWAAGAPDGARVTVLAACDLLADGVDTPSLRDLAALPLNAGWWEARDVLMATLDELGIDFVEGGSVEARLLVMRSLCRTYLTGARSERDFVESCIGMFIAEYDDAPAASIQLSFLYFSFEMDDGELNPEEAARLTRVAEQLAREFLAATA